MQGEEPSQNKTWSNQIFPEDEARLKFNIAALVVAGAVNVKEYWTKLLVRLTVLCKYSVYGELCNWMIAMIERTGFEPDQNDRV